MLGGLCLDCRVETATRLLVTSGRAVCAGCSLGAYRAPGDRRFAPRVHHEGRCQACGDFGQIDLNIQRCEDCAIELRREV